MSLTVTQLTQLTQDRPAQVSKVGWRGNQSTKLPPNDRSLDFLSICVRIDRP